MKHTLYALIVALAVQGTFSQVQADGLVQTCATIRGLDLIYMPNYWVKGGQAYSSQVAGSTMVAGGCSLKQYSSNGYDSGRIPISSHLSEVRTYVYNNTDAIKATACYTNCSQISGWVSDAIASKSKPKTTSKPDVTAATEPHKAGESCKTARGVDGTYADDGVTCNATPLTLAPIATAKIDIAAPGLVGVKCVANAGGATLNYNTEDDCNKNGGKIVSALPDVKPLAITPAGGNNNPANPADKKTDQDTTPLVSEDQDQVGFDAAYAKSQQALADQHAALYSKYTDTDPANIKAAKDGLSELNKAKKDALATTDGGVDLSGYTNLSAPQQKNLEDLASAKNDLDDAKKDPTDKAGIKSAQTAYNTALENVNADKSSQKTAISDAKDAKDVDKDNYKNAANNTNSGTASQQKSIAELNTANGGGRHYGLKSTTTTNTNLQTIAIAQGALNTIGGAAVNQAGNSASNGLIAKGATATQTDYIDAQKKAAAASVTMNGTVALANTAAAVMQYQWSRQHGQDANKVETIAAGAKNTIDGIKLKNQAPAQTAGTFYQNTFQAAYDKEYAGKLQALPVVCRAQNKNNPAVLADCDQLGTPESAAVIADSGNNILKNYVTNARNAAKKTANETANAATTKVIEDNKTKEQTAQQATADKAAGAAVQSAMGAAQAAMNAIATKNAMNQLTATDTGGGFAFNPTAPGGYGDDGVAPDPVPVAGAIVDGTMADDALKNTDQFNPGVDGGPGGNDAKGAFAPGNLAGAPGGAGGPAAVGGGAGTSAAQDDSKKDNSPPGKGAAGSYTANDNTAAGTYSRNGGGGGSGVGMDNSFADLLKKFLPGGDEDKKQDGAMAFDQDRGPASDSAAVLGRNKNIFEEIHKRYEKKNSEGAIVF